MKRKAHRSGKQLAAAYNAYCTVARLAQILESEGKSISQIGKHLSELKITPQAGNWSIVDIKRLLDSPAF